MNQKPTQSSFDSDGEQTVSSEAIPLSSTSADETPGFGSDAKRQKVEEDEKVKGGDGDVSVEAEDDGTDEIEDGDDDEDDDFVEVKQYSPKVMTWNRCSEDDEGYQRYVKKIVDSQGFDLDEDPRQEYLFPGFGVCKVYFEDPQHAHHKEYVRKCITEAIKQQSEPLTYVDTLSANYAVNVGYIYFITFRATQNSTSELKTFQTEVSHDIWGEMKVEIFREKAQ